MATTVILGFVLLLAGWFSRLSKVRRDYPNRDAGKYSSYTGPRFFGLFSRRSGLSLLWFYREHHGFDARLCTSLIGLGLILLAIVTNTG